MAIADRSQMVRTKGRDDTARGKELMAGILLAALLASLGLRGVVTLDALAPVIVTLLFAAGAITAGLALLCRRHRFRTWWFDLAGGLTFIGATTDNFLRAFDNANGAEVWKMRLPAGAQATPMSYAVGGRQYVVVAAGGHAKFGTTRDDYVLAYALPQSALPQSPAK